MAQYVDPAAATNAFFRTTANLQAGRDARQANAMRQMDIDHQNAVNALRSDPNTTVEQFARGGDLGTANALTAMRNNELSQQQAQLEQRQRALSNVAPIAAHALTLDPMTRKTYLKNAIPVFADDFKALGSNVEQGLGQIDAMQDSQLEQMLQQVSQFAPRSAGAKVQSTQVLEDGTIAYITDAGQLVRTNERARNPLQFGEVGGAKVLIDRLGGGAQVLSSAQAEEEAKRRAAQTGAEGKGQGERTTAAIDSGMQAADAISTTRRGLDLLRSVKTGGLNSAMLRASNMFGVTGADEAELSANLGKAVLSQLRTTFGAAFTEKEGERLQNIEAGFGKSTEANIRLLEQAEKILDRAARRGMAAAEASGDTFAVDEIRNALNFSFSEDPKKPPTRGNAPPSGRPRPGTIEDGYEFIGGDERDPRSWRKVQ